MTLHLMGAGLKGQERAFDQRNRVISYVRFGCSYGSSSGRLGGQDAVELSSDVALQTADDLGLGLAFLGASLDVGAGRPVPGHPPDRDQVQRPVRLSVAAPVQPVPGDLARGGRDREDVPTAVELGWRSSGAQAASSLVGVTARVASGAARRRAGTGSRCRGGTGWPPRPVRRRPSPAPSVGPASA